MGVSSLGPLSTLAELRELYMDGLISGRYTVDSLFPVGDLKQLQFAVLMLRVAKANRTLAPLHDLKRLTFLHLSADYSAEEYDSLVKTLPGLKEMGAIRVMRPFSD